MGLGQNAFTVASHLALITILGVLAFRVLAAKASGLLHLAIDRGLTSALTIAALALIIERSYYVIARFLIMSSGTNLWKMHPAPEMLALVVAIGLYAIMIPMQLATASRDRNAWAKIVQEILLILLFWSLTAWVLH